MKIVQEVIVNNEYGFDVDNEVRVYFEDEWGKKTSLISFWEGEPEDMTLNRDLNDVYSIAGMLEQANKLGLEGKELYVENKTIKED